jgi:hypothetical protein
MKMNLMKRNYTESTLAPPVAKKKGLVGEISTGWATSALNGIRYFRRTFWPTPVVYGGTVVSYATARALYRNDQKNSNLGAGFGRRIINSTMDFTGLPQSDTGDEVIDEFLNKCIHTYWNGKLIEAIRDCCRDADTVIRIRRYDPENPLVSAEEWESCYLEVIPPESCTIFYKQGGDNLEIEVAYVRHEYQERVENASSNGTRVLAQPIVKERVVIEEITPKSFRYYDETNGKWDDSLEEVNSWGFVPLLEMHNEYDSAIKGGQSDFEACLPFIMAFHDVVSQSLVSHKAHSIPKVKFRVRDMLQFMANNWPEEFDSDENGQPVLSTFSGNVSWKGTEMLFIGEDEEVDFLEVSAASGDPNKLLDFLLTCISITSETPRSVLMVGSNSDENEMVVFSKKINRKRGFFAEYIQVLCKMVLSINHMEPIKVPLVWDDITPAIALENAQVLEQAVMAAEVLATRQVISDDTVRRHVSPFIRGMKSGSKEAADAKNNVVPEAPATSTSAVKGDDSGNKSVTGNKN